MTSTSQKVFGGHKKCADSSVGKASSCIWESYLEPFTKTTEFSLYERQTAAYRLICERQEDSGLQLWTAGSTQLQLDTYFFLNSSSHNIHPSTAKPQKVLCRPAHGQTPHLSHPLPYREVGLKRSQHQQPQLRWDMKLKQRSSTRLHCRSPKEEKRK